MKDYYFKLHVTKTGYSSADVEVSSCRRVPKKYASHMEACINVINFILTNVSVGRKIHLPFVCSLTDMNEKQRSITMANITGDILNDMIEKVENHAKNIIDKARQEADSKTGADAT